MTLESGSGAGAGEQEVGAEAEGEGEAGGVPLTQQRLMGNDRWQLWIHVDVYFIKFCM